MSESVEDEVYYRYEDKRVSVESGYDSYVSVCRVQLRCLPIIGRTRKGVWLDMGLGTRRFVLFQGRKRFALPTEQEAKASFIARKERQIRLLKQSVDFAERALQQVGTP